MRPSRQWYLIAAGLTALVLSLAGCANTRVAVGPTIITDHHSDSATILVQKTFKEKYRATVGYISPQHIETCDLSWCVWDIDSQFLAGLEYVFQGEMFSFSVGPYVFENEDRITSCRLLWRLGPEVKINDWLSLGLSHFTNVGMCSRSSLANPNDDRTGAENHRHVKKYNVGFDALFIIVNGRF